MQTLKPVMFVKAKTAVVPNIFVKAKSGTHNLCEGKNIVWYQLSLRQVLVPIIYVEAKTAVVPIIFVKTNTGAHNLCKGLYWYSLSLKRKI